MPPLTNHALPAGCSRISIRRHVLGEEPSLRTWLAQVPGPDHRPNRCGFSRHPGLQEGPNPPDLSPTHSHLPRAPPSLGLKPKTKSVVSLNHEGSLLARGAVPV